MKSRGNPFSIKARYLRVRGTLPAGAIITVEPGVSPSTHIFRKRELIGA
jgi:hypothetical protein